MAKKTEGLGRLEPGGDLAPHLAGDDDLQLRVRAQEGQGLREKGQGGDRATTVLDPRAVCVG